MSLILFEHSLIVAHEAYVGLEPDKQNLSGKITAKKVYDLFHSVRKIYSKSDANWTLSGKHCNHDFANYCNGQPQPLYLHHWLQRLGNPEITAYCKEGNSIEGGFTGLNITPTSTTSSGSFVSSNNSASKRDSQLFDILSRGQESSGPMKMASTECFNSLKRKTDEETISLILNNIEKIEEDIDQMRAEGVDPSNSKFMRKSRELDRLNQNYASLTGLSFK